jgi:hypothetical protein
LPAVNIAGAMAGPLKTQGAEVAGAAATVSDTLALIANTERIDVAVLDISLRGTLVYPVVDTLRSKGAARVEAASTRTSALSPAPCRQVNRQAFLGSNPDSTDQHILIRSMVSVPPMIHSPITPERTVGGLHLSPGARAAARFNCE